MEAYFKDLEEAIRGYEDTLRETDILVKSVEEKRKMLDEAKRSKHFLHPSLAADEAKLKEINRKIEILEKHLNIQKPFSVSSLTPEKRQLLRELEKRMAFLHPALARDREELKKIFKQISDIKSGKGRKTRRRKTRTRKASK